MSNDPHETTSTTADAAPAIATDAGATPPTAEARAAMIEKAVALADATVREIRADAVLRDVR